MSEILTFRGQSSRARRESDHILSSLFQLDRLTSSSGAKARFLREPELGGSGTFP